MRRLSLLVAAVVVVPMVGACSAPGGRTVVALFEDVGDLVGRANVQQSDAVVGTVRSIELVEHADRWQARVEMRLNDEASVRVGTRAIVRSTSLLGEKYVDLVPPVEQLGGELPDGAIIPQPRTAKAPELEDVFAPLGAILQGGALEDLARLSTAGAMILEGQEEHVGRVLDGTAKLVSSLRRAREALAAGLSDLASASRTLRGGVKDLDRALDVGDDARRIVADQRDTLEDLVVQLDRLGQPLGDLTRNHSHDVDAQVRAVRAVVPKLYEARDVLEAAVSKLPAFTKLFAEAIPGDYVQLNVLAEALPIEQGGATGAISEADVLADMLLEATR